MLEVKGLAFNYGPVRALSQVDLMVSPGELVCLLGANGAGKTTLLNLISGLLKPGRGVIRFRGQDLTQKGPAKAVAAGVVQVPEGRQLFAGLSVADNLELGAFVRRKDRAFVKRNLEKVYETFPALAERRGQLAGTLSGGEQQMAAIGRGLMAGPKVLLLDEPSLGLAPLITREIFGIISSLPKEGTSVLLVEQNALAALAVAQRGYVLTNGRIRFGGASQEIFEDELLREAFLGPERAKKEGRT